MWYNKFVRSQFNHICMWCIESILHMRVIRALAFIACEKKNAQKLNRKSWSDVTDV